MTIIDHVNGAHYASNIPEFTLYTEPLPLQIIFIVNKIWLDLLNASSPILYESFFIAAISL